MKVEWLVRKGRHAAAVIPTMDASQERVQSLSAELSASGVDSLAVVDRLPEFRFSCSMNCGIDEALNDGVRILILSNDDVSEIRGLHAMCAAVSPEIYAAPYVNGRLNLSVIATTRLRYVYNLTVTRHAPFFALKTLKKFGMLSGRKPFAMGVPATDSQPGAFVRVQPFAVFAAETILRFNKFDENIINGLEDDELGYRLLRNGYHSISRPEWNIAHKGGASFRDSMGGKALMSDLHVAANAMYFHSKHFSKDGWDDIC